MMNDQAGWTLVTDRGRDSLLGVIVLPEAHRNIIARRPRENSRLILVLVVGGLSDMFGTLAGSASGLLRPAAFVRWTAAAPPHCLCSRPIPQAHARRMLATDSRRRRQLIDALLDNKQRAPGQPVAATATQTAKHAAPPSATPDNHPETPLGPTDKGASDSDALPPGFKQKWFKDPYLLASFVRKQIKHDGREHEITQFVKRHVGAGNAVVWSVLIRGLGRKGMAKQALAALKEMRRRRMTPTPQCYNSILNALAEGSSAPTADSDKRAEYLGTARELWRELRTPSIIQYNTMLKLCRVCAAEGGWDLAWRLFRPLVPTQFPLERKRTYADETTYTIVLGMCGDRGDEQAFEAAKDIWAAVQRLTDYVEAGTKKARQVEFSVDARLFTSMLYACTRAPKRSGAQYALELVETWLALPGKLGETRYNLSAARVKLSTPMLGLLMHVASDLSNSKLGLLWFNMLTKTAGVVPDAEVYNTLVMALLREKDYGRAWKVAKNATETRLELSLRVVSIALASDFAQRLGWMHTAQEVAADAQAYIYRRPKSDNDKPLDLRSVVNLLDVLMEFQDWESAWKLLDHERSRIVDGTRKRLEKLVVAAAPSLNSSDLAGKPMDVLAILAKKPGDEVELRARLRGLVFAKEVCNQVLAAHPKDEAIQLRVELFQRQLQEVLDVWNMIETKTSRIETPAPSAIPTETSRAKGDHPSSEEGWRKL